MVNASEAHVFVSCASCMAMTTCRRAAQTVILCNGYPANGKLLQQLLTREQQHASVVVAFKHKWGITARVVLKSMYQVGGHASAADPWVTDCLVCPSLSC